MYKSTNNGPAIQFYSKSAAVKIFAELILYSILEALHFKGPIYRFIERVRPSHRGKRGQYCAEKANTVAF